MRQTHALTALTEAITAHFPADVAEAIRGDEDLFDACARLLARTASSPEDVDKVVVQLRETTEDSTLDWLVDGANSPAGWLHRQLSH